MAPPHDTFLIWGGGGHGKVVADVIRAAGGQVAGFVDRDSAKFGEQVEPGGARVIIGEAELLAHIHERQAYPEGIDGLALGIGDNPARQHCLTRLGAFTVPQLVHPSAVVSPSAVIGRGTVVLPGAVINADVWIGEAVIINSGAIVEHDCRIATAVHVSPGATLTGGVRVGERSWIGAGATILPGLDIGADVLVGAGAVVVRDVPDGLTVRGVPAGAMRPEDRAHLE